MERQFTLKRKVRDSDDAPGILASTEVDDLSGQETEPDEATEGDGNEPQPAIDLHVSNARPAGRHLTAASRFTNQVW